MEFGEDYHSKQGDKVLNALADPSVDVFAFQEMNRSTGKPQNDKPIFDSITSLMKAQAYELRALPKRKTDLAIYHFSLISVVDTEIVKLLFLEETIDASEIDSEQILANYIINKEQDVSRIRFIRASAFAQMIFDYDELHSFNCRVFSEYCDKFYKNILEDCKRTKVFIEDFQNKLWWPLYSAINTQIKSEFNKTAIDLLWNVVNKYIEITLPLDERQLVYLNNNPESKNVAEQALKDIYRSL